jgi:hypothetical protein
VISIWICHALERFYLGIDMFNHHTIPCKPFVVRLLHFTQFMLFACPFPYPAVHVQLFYPQISKVRIYPDGSGTMKRSMDAAYCLTRGLRNMAEEFSLTFLDYNLKRVINILGCKRLMEYLTG